MAIVVFLVKYIHRTQKPSILVHQLSNHSPSVSSLRNVALAPRVLELRLTVLLQLYPLPLHLRLLCPHYLLQNLPTLLQFFRHWIRVVVQTILSGCLVPPSALLPPIIVHPHRTGSRHAGPGDC